MVLGILNLSFASLGILGGCYGLFSPVIMKATNPAMADLYTGVFLVVAVALIVLGLASKTLMLMSGLGLIKGKAWGRRLGLLWAWCSIPLGLIILAVNVAYVTPQVIEATKLDMQNQGAGPPPGFDTMLETMVYASTIIGGLIAALPYQLTFIILMNRASVKDHFANHQGGVETLGHPSETPSADPWS